MECKRKPKRTRPSVEEGPKRSSRRLSDSQKSQGFAESNPDLGDTIPENGDEDEDNSEDYKPSGEFFLLHPLRNLITESPTATADVLKYV